MREIIQPSQKVRFYEVKIMVRILLHGIDWLEVSIEFVEKGGRAQYLQILRDTIFQAPINRQVDFLNRRWIVLPHSYSYRRKLIGSDGFELRVDNRTDSGNAHLLSIILRKPSDPANEKCHLWDKPFEAMRDFINLVQSYYGVLTETPKQCDFFCHFTNWDNTKEKGELFSTTYQKRREYSKGEFDNYSFGNPRAKVKKSIATIYEIQNRLKVFPESFCPYGYYPSDTDLSESIYNLEFKWFRQSLREMGISSLSQLEASVSELWANSTQKKLKLHLHKEGLNSSRWPLDPDWTVIQNAFGEGVIPLKKIKFESRPLSTTQRVKRMEAEMLAISSALGLWNLTFEQKLKKIVALVNPERISDESMRAHLANRNN